LYFYFHQLSFAIFFEKLNLSIAEIFLSLAAQLTALAACDELTANPFA